MIKSMTGCGRAEASNEKYTITVELKSVNHRYFDFNCRISRGFAFLEDKIRQRLASLIARGKVDAFITIERFEQSGAVEINHGIVKGYIDAVGEIADKYGLSGDVTAFAVSRIPDAVSVTVPPIDENEIWDMLAPLLDGAAASMDAMRAVEGERMYLDIKGRVDYILGCVDKIEKLYPQSVRQYRERIEARIKELLGGAAIDEQRIVTETAIMADRLAVDEETVRLRSHMTQLGSMLDMDEPTGRKMDFIVQEMNREINTIGSKSQDIEITKCVVEVKSEIEKIREQVQNIQ